MNALHLLAMLFSFGRIIEILGIDRITHELRKSFPSYLWNCPRCLSVWAAIPALLLYRYAPWVNWVFALSWLYIAYVDRKTERRRQEQMREGRKLTAVVSGDKLHWDNKLSQVETEALALSLCPHLSPVHSEAKK